MYYHAKIFFVGNKNIFTSNWVKERFIEKIMIPFINGHVIPFSDVRDAGLGEKQKILNLKIALELIIYRTKTELNTFEKSIHDQMSDANFEQYECTEQFLFEAKLLNNSQDSQSLLQQTFSIKKNKVFVVMKDGNEELDSAYERVIKKVFKEFGLLVTRAKEIQDSGKIDEQILQSISASKFVFCELTGERPNCYYETGYAQALGGREIILSIKHGHDIHFDLAANRFIIWKSEKDLATQLRERIRSLIRVKE